MTTAAGVVCSTRADLPGPSTDTVGCSWLRRFKHQEDCERQFLEYLKALERKRTRMLKDIAVNSSYHDGSQRQSARGPRF